MALLLVTELSKLTGVLPNLPSERFFFAVSGLHQYLTRHGLKHAQYLAP